MAGRDPGPVQFASGMVTAQEPVRRASTGRLLTLMTGPGRSFPSRSVHLSVSLLPNTVAAGSLPAKPGRQTAIGLEERRIRAVSGTGWPEARSSVHTQRAPRLLA
jgi:hypothetical protein